MDHSSSRDKIYERCGNGRGGIIAWGNGGEGKVVVIKSQKFIYMKRNPHEMNPLERNFK